MLFHAAAPIRLHTDLFTLSDHFCPSAMPLKIAFAYSADIISENKTLPKTSKCDLVGII